MSYLMVSKTIHVLHKNECDQYTCPEVNRKSYRPHYSVGPLVSVTNKIKNVLTTVLSNMMSNMITKTRPMWTLVVLLNVTTVLNMWSPLLFVNWYVRPTLGYASLSWPSLTRSLCLSPLQNSSATNIHKTITSFLK